jgi:hypothetical protein
VASSLCVLSCLALSAPSSGVFDVFSSCQVSTKADTALVVQNPEPPREKGTCLSTSVPQETAPTLCFPTLALVPRPNRSSLLPLVMGTKSIDPGPPRRERFWYLALLERIPIRLHPAPWPRLFSLLPVSSPPPGSPQRVCNRARVYKVPTLSFLLRYPPVRPETWCVCAWQSGLHAPIVQMEYYYYSPPHLPPLLMLLFRYSLHI